MNATYNIEIIAKYDKYKGQLYFVGRNPSINSVEWTDNPQRALQFDRDDPWELSELLRELHYLIDRYTKHYPEEGVDIWPVTIQSKPSTL